MFSPDIWSKNKIDFINNLFFWVAVAILASEILGFGVINDQTSFFNSIYRYLNVVFSVLSLAFSTILYKEEKNKSFKFIKGFFVLFCIIYIIFSILWLFDSSVLNISAKNYVLFFSTSIAFLCVGYKIASLRTSMLHPSIIFVSSFLLLIFFGAFMLLLPSATTHGIDIIDALFTATSAVTVTGLATLDTAKDFTFFGQIIILILIQLGGLGILTFSNLFSLLFKSETSFKNRLMVSEITKELNNANVFKTLFKIVFITFLVELMGAMLIYLFTYQQASNPFFFAIFHAVSAFCNAGFSTLSSSLYEGAYQFNYSFQLVIAWLIITGGIGYNLMINHYNYIKNFLFLKINKFSTLNLEISHTVKKINLNTHIVLRTTFWLLVVGFIGFLTLEWCGALVSHKTLWGKIVVSFFNSVTPRTAGFNDIDMALLGTPTVMLIIILMWIGASPGSTGGGIKTTTFAISVMNLFNQIRGKEKIVLVNKQVATSNILLVNSIILLSIFAIGTGTFFLSIFEPNMLLRDLLFECVSAYSTVGLSLGITFKLTIGSKITLIFLMFLGRVSFLTLLIGIWRQIKGENKKKHITYPKETVFIN